MARTIKNGVNVYYGCSDGSVVKQTYSDCYINNNTTDFAAGIASINAALDKTGTVPGGGWFQDVWYKDADSMGTTDTLITGIVCVQEEITTTNDVYGTRP